MRQSYELQHRERKRVGTEHRRPSRRRPDDIRTVRLARQDRRRTARHDAYRQQFAGGAGAGESAGGQQAAGRSAQMSYLLTYLT